MLGQNFSQYGCKPEGVEKDYKTTNHLLKNWLRWSMHARHSFAIGWWPDGENWTTWTFKRFLNSLAHLPLPEIIHFQLYYERNLPEFHCSAAALWEEGCWYSITSVTYFFPWSENSSEQRPHVCLCGMYNRVLTPSEHLRSTVKLIIYQERGCLLFRMACTVLADDRTHTAQKAAAASHPEPCPAQHIQRFQSPALLQYTLLNFVVE